MLGLPSSESLAQVIMLQSNDLTKIPPLPQPIALTIGNFDGIHLGHLALIHRLKHYVKHTGAITVLTFANHPSHILHAHQKGFKPTPLLCSLEYKLKLLCDLNVNLVLLPTFTPAFAKQPFDVFLTQLKEHLPFSYLLLGEGASLGKDRQGNPEQIAHLSKTLHFNVEYMPKILIDDHPVSSGRIRQELQNGNLPLVQQLLGRPFTLFLPITSYQLSLDTLHLCLPPDGLYQIQLFFPTGIINCNGTISHANNTLDLQSIGNQIPLSNSPVKICFQSNKETLENL